MNRNVVDEFLKFVDLLETIDKLFLKEEVNEFLSLKYDMFDAFLNQFITTCTHSQLYLVGRAREMKKYDFDSYCEDIKYNYKKTIYDKIVKIFKSFGNNMALIDTIIFSTRESMESFSDGVKEEFEKIFIEFMNTVRRYFS